MGIVTDGYTSAVAVGFVGVTIPTCSRAPHVGTPPLDGVPHYASAEAEVFLVVGAEQTLDHSLPGFAPPFVGPLRASQCKVALCRRGGIPTDLTLTCHT